MFDITLDDFDKLTAEDIKEKLNEIVIDDVPLENYFLDKNDAEDFFNQNLTSQEIKAEILSWANR